MVSIRSKFTAICLLFILLSTAIVGGSALLTILRIQEQSSDEIMSLTCLQQAEELNEELMHVKTSVDACAELMQSNVTSSKSLTNPTTLATYMEDIERQITAIGTNTPGVCTYYVRINPDLTTEQTGFFYTKTGRSTALTKQPLTDLPAFDPDDVEHVGWFYQPIQAGRAIWMDPYYNQNINVYMISYVTPVYLKGELLGIVGMDVDFDVIINVMRHIKPYQTGRALLVSQEGKVYYHPTIPIGESVVDYAPELEGLVGNFPNIKSGEKGECITFVNDGVAKKITYCGLINGMVLMLTAESSEIDEPVLALVHSSVLVVILLSLLMVLVVLRTTDHITKPLIQLTHAADQIAQGNMEVELPAPTNDEVGILTRSFDATVRSLKAYISGMHSKAFTDQLTHVKNKAAYDAAIERLAGQMADGQGNVTFGLLMLDVNDLKLMNDRYGHDRGDDYLRNSCQMICRVFKHSPVYRVGGDEFVAILERGDLENRDALLAELDLRMVASETRQSPWECVSLAKGLGVSTPTDTTPDEVFRRADRAMYEDKRRMKRGR